MSQMLPEMFDALGEEAAQAMKASAEADAKFFEQTAAHEETAVQRIADDERQIAGQASAVREQAGQATGRGPGLGGRASNDKLINALRDWNSERFQFGNEQFLLDRGDFGHILSRHMPEFWDGSSKAEQTFFDPGMSVSDVQDAIRNVLRQNRDTLISRGTNAIYPIRGFYGGREYVLGINNGHIGQFYPLPRS